MDEDGTGGCPFLRLPFWHTATSTVGFALPWGQLWLWSSWLVWQHQWCWSGSCCSTQLSQPAGWGGMLWQPPLNTLRHLNEWRAALCCAGAPEPCLSTALLLCCTSLSRDSSENQGLLLRSGSLPAVSRLMQQCRGNRSSQQPEGSSFYDWILKKKKKKKSTKKLHWATMPLSSRLLSYWQSDFVYERKNEISWCGFSFSSEVQNWVREKIENFPVR